MKANARKTMMMILFSLFVIAVGILATGSICMAAPENRGDVIDVPFKAEKPLRWGRAALMLSASMAIHTKENALSSHTMLPGYMLPGPQPVVANRGAGPISRANAR